MPRSEKDWEDEFGPRIAAAAEIMRKTHGQVEILIDADGNVIGSETKLRQERGAYSRFGAGPKRKRGSGQSRGEYQPRIYRTELSEDFDASS